MFTAVNNNKYKKICTLDAIHVKKQHNKESRHIIEMFTMVVMDLLLHKCPCTAVTNCFKPKFTLVTSSAAIAIGLITRPQGRTGHSQISNIRQVGFT